MNSPYSFIFVIFLCIIIVLFTSILFTRVYSQNSIKQYIVNTKNKENSTDKSDVTEYVDNTALKIKLQYPHNWKYTENWKHNRTDISIMFVPAGSIEKSVCSTPSLCIRTNQSAGVHISVVPAYRRSLDSVTADKMHGLKLDYADSKYKITNFSSTNIAGHNAYKIEFLYQQNLTRINLIYERTGIVVEGRVMEIVSVIGDKVYTIHYSTALESDYYTYLPDANKIINSMKFQNLSNSTDTINKADIELFDPPTSIAVNPSTNKIYLGSDSNSVISIVSEENDKVIKTLKATNAQASAITINHETNKIYVANSNSNSISVIDGLSDDYNGHAIHVGKEPTDIAIDTIFDVVFVSNRESNAISVIFNGAVNGNISVEKEPSSLAINPITGMLYVANYGSNSISAIDYTFKNNTFIIIKRSITNIPVGNQPVGVSINPKTNKVYVTNSYDDTVSVIDGISYNLIKTIPTKSLSQNYPPVDNKTAS
jgi:YVTN family beta-propeller protein